MEKVPSFHTQKIQKLKKSVFKMKRKILCHICEGHIVTECVDLEVSLFLGKQEIALPSYYSKCKGCGDFSSPEQVNLNAHIMKIHIAALHEKYPEEKISSHSKVFHKGGF